MLFFKQIYKANFPIIKKPLQIIVYNFLEKNYRAKNHETEELFFLTKRGSPCTK